MSVDNSVVDSSVTDWKLDVENKNNRESPNEKVDKDAYRSGAEDQDVSCEQVGTSNTNKRSKSGDTRYFIIKSLNLENIQLSIQRGIWATQVMNEPILEEAYHNSGKVILIYSVNMSGYFQGYAQMMSSVGWRRDNVWSNGYGGSKPWGRSFKVKWLRLHDLPFQKTLHLKNPLNDYKPVKISRDCQELPQDIGEALCELIDGEGEGGMDENQTFCGLQDMGPMHLGPLMYPSFYQHASPQNPFISRSVDDVDIGGDGSSLYDGWDMSAERSLHANALTDDDILDMTYEEYLEAHSRGNRISHQSVNESSRKSRDSSVSKANDDDAYSRSRSKKRARHHDGHSHDDHHSRRDHHRHHSSSK
ncbi:putative YTH domain-containing protein [Helianthus annuus]|nr:putative YTH domain-containing protein [Helianthus annuus]